MLLKLITLFFAFVILFTALMLMAFNALKGRRPISGSCSKNAEDCLCRNQPKKTCD